MAEAVGSTNQPEPSAAQTAPVAPTGRNRRVGIILLGLLAVLLIAGGLWYIRYQTHGRYFQSTNDAYVQSDAVVVASKVAGYVDQIFVNDNQAVRTGQQLLRVDPREFEAQAAQSQEQRHCCNATIWCKSYFTNAIWWRLSQLSTSHQLNPQSTCSFPYL